MKIISVKKYFAKLMLVGASLFCSCSAHAAAVKLLQGFPYKPLWDLAVITKKQGIQQVSNALIKPPVVYYAVSGALAYAVWSYCEVASWLLERQKVTADTAEKSALRNAAARRRSLVDADIRKSMGKQKTIAKQPRLSHATLNKYKTLTQVELRRCDENSKLDAARTARLNRLWWIKWISLGIGSLAFMKTYKVWPKDSITN